MRPRSFSLLCFALAIFLVSAVDAQTARRLEGTWQGALPDKPSRGSRELQRGGPAQLPIIVAIQAASDGTYTGKWLSNPPKGLGDIENVAVDGDTVRFGVPSQDGVFEGRLTADGSTLTGEWRQRGKTTPLILRRTGNADESASFNVTKPGTVIRR